MGECLVTLPGSARARGIKEDKMCVNVCSCVRCVCVGRADGAATYCVSILSFRIMSLLLDGPFVISYRLSPGVLTGWIGLGGVLSYLLSVVVDTTGSAISVPFLCAAHQETAEPNFCPYYFLVF